MNNIVFIEKYPNLKVNINRLLSEFNNTKLEDVTNHNNKTLVQRKFHILKDVDDYHEVITSYSKLNKFSYTLEIAETLRKTLDFNSITYRSIEPNTCYNWHTDPGKICYHIPLITNQGCWFIYEHRSFHMPATGEIYIVNNSRPHTFVNAGDSPRIHITFDIL